MMQMIPSQLKFSMEGATPSFADNEGQVVEAGSQVRLRIKGIRSELNQMYAIGSIREDYLGYGAMALLSRSVLFANCSTVLLCNRRGTVGLSMLSAQIPAAELLSSLLQRCTNNLDFSAALERLIKAGLKMEKKAGEGGSCLRFSCRSRYPIRTNCSSTTCGTSSVTLDYSCSDL